MHGLENRTLKTLKLEIMSHIKIEECSELLANKKLKIAFIESATAGAVAAAFALTPYSGDVLVGGLICYDLEVKTSVLKISKELVEKYSAESQEITKQMAVKGKKLFKKADVIIAVTGLTKPGGSESIDKPVGTVFINFILPSEQFGIKKVFDGSADEIVTNTTYFVADFLIAQLNIK